MQFEIHQAQPHEAEPLLLMLNQAVAYKLSHGDNIWGSEPYTLEEARNTIDRGNTYIVTADEKPAASAVLIYDDERTWGAYGLDDQAVYLHRIVVADGFHGLGLSKYIVTWAGEQAQVTDRPYVRLDCSRSNDKLCELYESMGFVAIDNAVVGKSAETAFYQKPALV